MKRSLIGNRRRCSSRLCGPGVEETVPLASPDRVSFELEAAPLLAKRCGDVACHGTERHAFALYAVGRRRRAGGGHVFFEAAERG